MGKDLLQQLFQGFQTKMKADLDLANVMIHPGEKGETKELDWKKWLCNLPKRYSITKGIVIDCNGNTSDEIDAIVYDKQYSPLVFTHNDVNYITAESVYAVFEVKPILNKENIIYAGNKVKSVRKLLRTSAPIVYSTGLKDPKPLHKILSGLLTTNCKWKNIESKLVEELSSLEQDQELDMICSLYDISCSVKYDRAKINLCGANDQEVVQVELNKNKEQDILMHLFLTLNTKLQIIGTVPAIEYDKYFDDVSSLRELYEENKWIQR